MENTKLMQQALDAAAAAAAATVNAVPHEPTVEAAQRVIELVRERVGHASSGHRRNDPVDTRPTLRQIMAEQRWGPRPALPDPKAAVDARRAQIQERIAALLTARAHAMAGGPIEQDLRVLQQQLDALPT